MNNQYISFWQNALTDAFNPEKQLETFNNLFSQTFNQFGDISSSMKNFSDGFPVKTPEEFFNFFNLSSADFLKSFHLYMELFGLISIDEYRELIKKYEKLKKEKQNNEKKEHADKSKVETQNQTIKTQKSKISTQEKKIASQKASLTKAKKEVADLKKKLAAKEAPATTAKKKAAAAKSTKTEK